MNLRISRNPRRQAVRTRPDAVLQQVKIVDVSRCARSDENSTTAQPLIGVSRMAQFKSASCVRCLVSCIFAFWHGGAGVQ